MYEAFFDLRERPFDLTPNPRFLLLTERHREALSNLEYGVSARKGLTLLLGEAGTGKTTLVRTALQGWAKAEHLIAYVNNPTLTRAEFVESLADSFGIAGETGASKTRFVAALTELAMRRHKEGLLTGLLIDEAQSLSNELLEEVRLLANIETPAEKVFQVVLAGQPELAGRLNEDGLRQLKQRVALRCSLKPLDLREMAGYISGRIEVAGGVGRSLFTREAVIAIHELSGGIPRVVNVICDNVLLSAFAANQRPASRGLVEDVARDFDLARARASEPEPSSEMLARPRPAPAPVSRETRVVKPELKQEDTSQVPLFGHFSAVRRRFSIF